MNHTKQSAVTVAATALTTVLVALIVAWGSHDQGAKGHSREEWKEHQPGGGSEHNYMVKACVVGHAVSSGHSDGGKPTTIYMDGNTFRGQTLEDSEQMARGAFQALVHRAVGRIAMPNGSWTLSEPRISSSMWHYRRE